MFLHLFVLHTFAQSEFSDVVINEALANERGSATAGEWVELYNCSEDPVDLSKWLFVDGNDTTTFAPGTLVQQGQFAILARRLVDGPDATSFEAIWGDSSGIWGDSPVESYLALEVSMVLRNSTDTVFLLDASTHAIVSQLWWTSDSGDGISWERLYPKAPDLGGSFRASISPDGSTPASINSVLPPAHDLTFDSLLIVNQPLPRPTDSLVLKGFVSSQGFEITSTSSITLFDDFNNDALLDADEPALTRALDAIPPLESSATTLSWNNPAPGRHNFVATLSNDGNESNDTSVVQVDVPFTFGALLLTEFLANPTVGGPEEWAEIYNGTRHVVSLTGLRIGDSLGTQDITSEAIALQPESFVVLCESEPAFRTYYSGFAGLLIEVSGWRGLNNSGDRLELRAVDNFVIDSVSYREVYDDDRSSARVATDVEPHFTNLWGASAAPDGASPGEANAQSDNAAGKLTVSVAPRVFAAGAGELARVRLSLPLFSEVEITIYDVAGRRVRTLLERSPFASSAIAWDGADDRQHTLPPGPYVVLVESFPERSRAKAVVVIAPQR